MLCSAPRSGIWAAWGLSPPPEPPPARYATPPIPKTDQIAQVRAQFYEGLGTAAGRRGNHLGSAPPLALWGEAEFNGMAAVGSKLRKQQMKLLAQRGDVMFLSHEAGGDAQLEAEMEALGLKGLVALHSRKFAGNKARRAAADAWKATERTRLLREAGGQVAEAGVDQVPDGQRQRGRARTTNAAKRARPDHAA